MQKDNITYRLSCLRKYGKTSLSHLTLSNSLSTFCGDWEGYIAYKDIFKCAVVLGDPIVSQDSFEKALRDLKEWAKSKRLVTRGKTRLPAMYVTSQFVLDGGLMSYRADNLDQYRRAASYVDKILKGTKPGNLPVEQPMMFEFVINLKTAKQIGVTIAPGGAGAGE